MSTKPIKTYGNKKLAINRFDLDMYQSMFLLSFFVSFWEYLFTFNTTICICVVCEFFASEKHFIKLWASRKWSALTKTRCCAKCNVDRIRSNLIIADGYKFIGYITRNAASFLFSGSNCFNLESIVRRSHLFFHRFYFIFKRMEQISIFFAPVVNLWQRTKRPYNSIKYIKRLLEINCIILFVAHFE